MYLKRFLKSNLGAYLLCILLCLYLIPAKSVMAAQDPVEGGDGTSIQWQVTYKDGRDGQIFSDYSRLVNDGDKTPVYVPEDGVYPGYEFDGWTPVLQQRVDCDMVYVATWKETGESASDLDPDSDEEVDSDIQSETSSQEDNANAAKENSKNSELVDDTSDDSSDATDQGLTDDTGSGKENAYADDVDSGDMNAPVIFGGFAVCFVILCIMIRLLKKSSK